MKKWVVYIVECSDGTLYTGITNDLFARIAKHNSGSGARYTKGRLPVKLMFATRVSSRSEATKVESRIKRLPKDKKVTCLMRVALFGVKHALMSGT